LERALLLVEVVAKGDQVGAGPDSSATPTQAARDSWLVLPTVALAAGDCAMAGMPLTYQLSPSATSSEVSR